MGGCRCSFRDCPNTTKTENIHFFHYPVKHKERCRMWIDYARKPHFCDLEEEQLRNKVICDQHFEDKWFPNPQKKRLLQGAVPTLLGKYNVNEATRQEPEISLFIPNDQDIQVLPANEDGTVFVLDTDTMFTKSQKIESYIYQNGTLVPSFLAPSSVVSSPVTPVQNLNAYSSPKSKEIQLHKEIMKEIEPVPKQNVVKSHMVKQEIDVKNEFIEIVDGSNVSQIRVPEQEDEEEFENLPKRLATEEKVVGNIIKQHKDGSVLDNTYLRKIKQHSRDIASIKRLLKEKVLTESKPNITTVLNILRDLIPPSLFTILALNLNQECELTEDDVDFFTIIHRTSPEVYQLLAEKFNWNLPSVDVVESIE